MISDHGHENSQFDVFDHPDVQFIMIMRRYPLFYNAFLITPCLLISFLTALVYYLPCASHQKITFCTSVLLGKKNWELGKFPIELENHFQLSNFNEIFKLHFSTTP